jgi:UDP-glucose 4-epimerase
LPALMVDSSRIKAELNWRPRHDDLDEIVRSALVWEEKFGG